MIFQGDCIEVMAGMDANSVDAIVTDPPYGLEFMGKDWDRLWGKDQSFNNNRKSGCWQFGNTPSSQNRPRYEAGLEAQAWHSQWLTEAYRVLKPGGSMLVMGGTRTFHRLACAIEDTGFIIKDTLAFMYGSGFPKAQDLTKMLKKKYCNCIRINDIIDNDETTKQNTEHNLRPMREADLSQAISDKKTKENIVQPGLSEQGLSEHRQERPESETTDGEQSSLEGRDNQVQEEGQLQEYPLHKGSEVGVANGEKRRIYNGAQVDNGNDNRKAANKSGDGSPRRPRPNQQPSEKSSSLPNQQGPQNGRKKQLCPRCGKPVISSDLNQFSGFKIGGIKPAYEPIIWAVKPPEGSYIDNVLKWGVGAINVDECRVGIKEQDKKMYRSKYFDKAGNPYKTKASATFSQVQAGEFMPNMPGRFPANVILDEEAGRELDLQSGTLKSGARGWGVSSALKNYKGGWKHGISCEASSGGASRFFYCAKASRAERNAGLEGMEEKDAKRYGGGDYGACDNSKPNPQGAIKEGNTHPTVKPISLMSWLIRLITREGQIVLDPFLGSGTTGIAAKQTGREFIGIEREAEYTEIATKRIEHHEAQPEQMEIGA